LIAGIGAGVGVEIVTHNMQVGVGEEIKKLMATEEKAQPLTARERSDQSMAELLNFSDDVMRRSAHT
jgi:hypothetical protein